MIIEEFFKWFWVCVCVFIKLMNFLLWFWWIVISDFDYSRCELLLISLMIRVYDLGLLSLIKDYWV